MTTPEAPTSGETGQPTETPGYTSPTEQLLHSLPFGIFQNLADRLSRAGGGGGQFSFSLDEMRELERQFRSEAESLDKMRKDSERSATALVPLAGDGASQQHHKQAVEHAKALDKAVKQQYEFAKGFETAITAAIERKTGEEEAGSEDFKSTGPNH